MNRKLNSIIAIVISIIIIGLMLFLSLSKEKTQADIINEQLRKQNASWIAVDYPREIMEIPIINSIEELEFENQIEHPLENIFNQETKNRFYSENNIIIEDKTTNKLSGLLILTTNTNKITNVPKPVKLEDNWYWKETYTPGKRQSYCGSCMPLALIAALEGYTNKKYNYAGKNKIDFSEQYLISYSNFKGCNGNTPWYYINLIKLDKSVNNTNIDIHLKKKINSLLNLQDKFVNNTNSLQTRTQLSFAVGEVPLGIPLEKQLPYVNYDSCEIIKLNKNKPGFAVTDMNLITLMNVYKNKSDFNTIGNYVDDLFDNNFCPDSADKDTNSEKNKLFVPVKRDDFEKYFVADYFKIDDKNCVRNKKQIIQNIKDGLKISPLIASIFYYTSIKNYKTGVWEKLLDENTNLYHGVVISGWGVDAISGREYWILKNNWNDSWGDGSYFRTWIGDSNLNIECNGIYGFSGEILSKSGQEINDLLPIAKQEIETEKKAEILNENLQQQIENVPQPTPTIPDLPTDLNPLKNYQMLNINYQDTKYISDKKCTNIMNCMSNKLAGFYGNNNQGNELT